MATVESSNNKDGADGCQYQNSGDHHPRIALSKMSRVHRLITCHYYSEEIVGFPQGALDLYTSSLT